MDKPELFKVLKKQSSVALLKLLEAAYDRMNPNQRRAVFSEFTKSSRPSVVAGQELLNRVKKFYKESLDGVYYAPFDINSKNFSYIPEETEEWFNRMGELLEQSSKLTQQGDHAKAVQCFRLLYELIETMERGEEIVFADEYGSWMIPGDEKGFTKTYISSLVAIATPEEFAATTIPLVKRDSYHSFFTKAHTVAMRVANKEQRARLQAEIERQKIRTPPKAQRGERI